MTMRRRSNVPVAYDYLLAAAVHRRPAERRMLPCRTPNSNRNDTYRGVCRAVDLHVATKIDNEVAHRRDGQLGVWPMIRAQGSSPA